MINTINDLNERIIKLIQILQKNNNIKNINDYTNNEIAYEHFKNLLVIKGILESIHLITNNDDKIDYFNHINNDISNILIEYEKELLN
jgi:DNA primase catalytic subunit